MNRVTAIVFLILGASQLWGSDLLVDPPQPPRSPEGHLALVDLQSQLEKAFKSSQIEKKYLAAKVFAQLKPEEVNRNILHAMIESLSTSNMNYRWYLAHLLKKFSQEDNQVNIEGWRGWLRERYQPVRRQVGPGSHSPEGSGTQKEVKIESTKEGSSSEKSFPQKRHEALKPPSWGHHNSGGVRAEDVMPDGQLGHDPLDAVDMKGDEGEMPSSSHDLSEKTHYEGSGSFEGSGIQELPQRMPPKSKNQQGPKVRSLDPTQDISREILQEEEDEFLKRQPPPEYRPEGSS